MIVQKEFDQFRYNINELRQKFTLEMLCDNGQFRTILFAEE